MALALGSTLRVLGVACMGLFESGRTHVGFRAHAKTNGERATVEIEDHSLALAEGSEYRAFESASGEFVVVQVGIADDGANPGDRVVGLDDSLQRTGSHGQRTALTTLPALRHDVQTLTRLVEPLTTARTR